MKPRVIAFYLPQFHPIPENDEWWGKGFTEWTNVGKAKPLFKGHDQPRVPTELGYYDLRMSEIRDAQAKMARDAGVEGFMYWHYWFGNGKTLMADIFDEVLESGNPDFPFALGWANHSWYAKNWNSDGSSTNRLLIEQTYPGLDDAKLHFNFLLKAFRDSRYIKIDGMPLLYIFDPDSLPECYLNWFKQWSKDAGFPGLYIVANLVKERQQKDIYINQGYTAVTHQRLNKKSSEIFRKVGIVGRVLTRVNRYALGFLRHRPPFMDDYNRAASGFVTDEEKELNVIPTIMPQWDHTPRSGWNGSLLINATPDAFRKIAEKAFNVVKDKDDERQIVFLKSWNEWGEGNYMEPDLTHGRGFINALRNAVDNVSKI